MENISLKPKATAIFTRFQQRGMDYDWYIKEGDLKLFKQIESIYYHALSDVKGDFAKCIVLVKKQTLGFLIAGLPAKRKDHHGRNISEALYIELDIASLSDIYLLLSNVAVKEFNYYLEIETIFSAYLNPFLLKYAKKTTKIPDSIKIPIKGNLKFQADLDETNVVLYANKYNYQRALNYFKQLPPQEMLFCLLFAGELNLKQCKKIENETGNVIILSFTQELLKDVYLRSIFQRKVELKKNFQQFKDKFISK